MLNPCLGSELLTVFHPRLKLHVHVGISTMLAAMRFLFLRDKVQTT